MSSGNILKENHVSNDTKDRAPGESQPFSLPDDEERPQEEDRDEDDEEE